MATKKTPKPPAELSNSGRSNPRVEKKLTERQKRRVPHQRQPTEKQRKMVEGLKAGKSLRRAALDAGYSEASASHPGRQILPSVAVNFQEIMRKYCPADKIAKTVAQSLDATIIKPFNAEGQIIYSKPLVNHSERRQAAELAAKLTGYHVDKQPDQAGNRLDELIAALKQGPAPRGSTND